MIIVMRKSATEEQIQLVMKAVTDEGLEPRRLDGVERTVIACIGDERATSAERFEVLEGVDRVMPVLQDYKLASRDGALERTRVPVRDVIIGDREIVVMAGPCSVESEEQIVSTARAVKAAGARILRGGAFKPRTSPYAFQGLAEDGLKLLATAREETGLPIVTEVMDPHNVELVGRYTDMYQIGARNVQNYALLREVGQTRIPVLLKRGMSTTLKEFVFAAEYILAGGNPHVVLCERGIRTFETATRNTLDLNALPVLQEWTHLPVCIDPSHGVGVTRWVPPLARAAVAAGADALMLEVHPDPAHAWSDGAQSLDFEGFAEAMDGIRRVAAAVDRTLPQPVA
ncbi:MAG: 3-deoxy-7-phosphoheptulonate synthase [Candidatus Dadabacteria bacterium]|nr:MAG: 3-deoxy-7-phosphoheptulonate synthase [Candidatus Dadabacteria bacterium]